MIDITQEMIDEKFKELKTDALKHLKKYKELQFFALTYKELLIIKAGEKQGKTLVIEYKGRDFKIPYTLLRL